MSEINKLTVNSKTYDLADKYARDWVKVFADNLVGAAYSPNILPVDYYDGDYKEHYGITFQRQADGTVIATGTNDNVASSRYNIAAGISVKAGTYTLSGIPEGATSGRILKYRIGNSGSYSYFKTGSRTFTVENDSTLYVQLEYNSGYAIEGSQQWCIMLEKGDTAHEYVKPGCTFDEMEKSIDNMEQTLSRHTTEIADMQAALGESADPADTTVLPEYYTDYMAERIEAINEKDCLIGSHGDSFVFITDTHLERNNMNSPGLIKEIVNNTSVRFVINGGDTLDRNGTKGEALELLRQWRNLMQGVTEYRIVGNHDLNASGQTVEEAILSFDDWYGTMVKPVEDIVKTDGKYYFCIDNENQKIRYICLSYKVNLAAERNWFKQRLTELEAGWTVLVIPHYLFDSTTDVIHTNGQYLINDINAVYADMNATLIGVLAGHTHVDYSTTEAVNGYHLITTTCDACTGAPVKTAGTVTEQAFDVIHIDTANRKLYATRIGAGEDRQWDY